MASQKTKLIALLLSLSACRIAPQVNTQKIEFQPPLTYSGWEIQQFTDSSGYPSCTVSSGYRGIEVTTHRQNGSSYLAIRGGQNMSVGELFTINVGRNHYQTFDMFTGSQATRLLEDLYKNDKAYVEWSEPDPIRNKRRRSTNILKLDGFRQQFDKCIEALSS